MHYNILFQTVFHLLLSISWRDIGEIAFCSITCYYGLHYSMPYWHTKPFRLLCCCILIGIVAYYADLHVILLVLSYATPYLLLIAFLYYQKTIQRILLTPTTAQYHTKLPYQLSFKEYILNWTLQAINKQKELYIIIERTNPIYTECIADTAIINTSLSSAIIDILLCSDTVSSQKMILLTEAGIIYGYNGMWKRQESVATSIITSPEEWIENTSLYLAQTDAFGIYVNPKNRLYTVIVHDTLIEQIDSNRFAILLDQLFQPFATTVNAQPIKGGVSYVNHMQKKSNNKWSH